MNIIPCEKISIVEDECNIPVVDEGIELWDPEIDYPNVGDEVIVLEYNGVPVNGVYLSLGKGEDGTNIGNHPIESELWIWDRPTNLYACVDYYPSTPTKSEDELILVFEAEQINHISLFGLNALHLKIEVFDNMSGSLIDIIEQDLVESPGNFYEFQTYCLSYTTSFATKVKFEMKQKIKLTLTGSSVKLGVIAMGKLEFLASTKWGVKNDTALLIEPTRDKYGTVTFGRNDYTKKVTLEMCVENDGDLYSVISQRLDSLLGIPCVFQGTNDRYKAHNIFGYYKRQGGVVESEEETSFDIVIESFKYEQEKNICIT